MLGKCLCLCCSISLNAGCWNAGIRKYICFKIFTVFIFSSYTLYYRGFLKLQRNKRAHCGRLYRNQQQTDNCLEVSSQHRWEMYKQLKGDLTKVNAMRKRKIRRKIQFSLLVQSNVPLALDWLNMWLLISYAWKREKSSNSVPFMNCAVVLVLHTQTSFISG